MKKERKKILYLITQSEMGGAQKYVYDLVRYLQADFDIAVAGGEQGENGELVGLLRKTRAVFYPLPHLKRSISPWSDLSALAEIKDLINRLEPDIIHLNSTKISVLGSLAARAYRRRHDQVRIIYTVHGWVMREPLPGWKKLLYTWAEKATAAYKDDLIIISNSELSYTVRNNIAPASKCHLIHHGIDRIDFRDRTDARDELRSHDCIIEADDIVIYSVGNLYPAKGYKHLIRAAKSLKNQGIKLRYVIAGEGEERDKLTRLINDLNLHHRCFLPGRLNGAELMPAADIYVSSSVKEGLSYTIMEAMQAGLPVIATDVGGCRDMIEDGSSGIVVPPADPNAIAAALSRLLLDPALRKRLGETARRRATSVFTTDKMIQATRDLYLGEK